MLPERKHKFVAASCLFRIVVSDAWVCLQEVQMRLYLSEAGDEGGAPDTGF